MRDEREMGEDISRRGEWWGEGCVVIDLRTLKNILSG